MKKKITFLLIALLFILSIFALFKSQIINYQNLIKASVIDSEMNELVINSAKSMVNKNINKYKKDEVIKITIFDLINKDYIEEDIFDKEPNLKEDDIVYVFLENHKIVDVYIKSKTLKDYLFEKDLNDNFIVINDSKYFVGNPSDNYLYFDNEIYRIIKVTKNGNIFIINDDKNEKINIKDLKDYYLDDKIIPLTLEEYNNTKLNNETFLDKEYEYFLKDNNEFKIINNYTNKSEAYLRNVVMLSSDVTIENGNGTILNPFIISEN